MATVELTADATRQFKRLPKWARPVIKEALKTHLELDDPARTTRNKFRLRRASEHADFELRVDIWRILYRIEDDDNVVVTVIGEKRGNLLIVEGEELKL